MSYLAQFASLLCAGTMMVTSSLQTIAPQRDIDGSLFLVNRTYRISEDYVPQVVQADVSGSLRSMRPEAAAALEEMFAACKEEAGVTLVTVSGYRSYQKQKNIYNNKLKSVGGSEALSGRLGGHHRLQLRALARALRGPGTCPGHARGQRAHGNLYGGFARAGDD